MKNKISSAELQERILLLESRRDVEWLELKQQFLSTYESLKPINMLRDTIKEMASSSQLKTTLVNSAISYGAGILAAKLVPGKTSNPFKKILGLCVELFVTNKVSENIDAIKSVGSRILGKMNSSQSEKEQG
jgi:hypothetical protein